jgi:hypothetical protein
VDGHRLDPVSGLCIAKAAKATKASRLIERAAAPGLSIVEIGIGIGIGIDIDTSDPFQRALPIPTTTRRSRSRWRLETRVELPPSLRAVPLATARALRHAGIDESLGR